MKPYIIAILLLSTACTAGPTASEDTETAEARQERLDARPKAECLSWGEPVFGTDGFCDVHAVRVDGHTCVHWANDKQVACFPTGAPND